MVGAMKRIAVFAKRPVPGRVKSRLSPALPAALACDLYRGMLQDALAAAAGAGAEQRWLYWAEADGPGVGLDAWGGFRETAQRGGTLGERLAGAFAELIPAAGDRAVVIGADCPPLDGGVAGAAFAALAEADLVLGPTVDGGYYLVGLARPAPALFRGIDWSTPQVLEQTLERAARAGLAARRLGPLDDIDTPADLVRFIARAALDPDPARAAGTRRALEGMALLPG
ncbi:MAG: hypothetical protein A2W00_10015 [Candidatus Eisenbacteria bacterium RBG_16_71_46]|nr:MAG: hypothetical protein A2W00_10015 [Candidatus Eisenbacteria bacterium RBG_16_71_46]